MYTVAARQRRSNVLPSNTVFEWGSWDMVRIQASGGLASPKFGCANAQGALAVVALALLATTGTARAADMSLPAAQMPAFVAPPSSWTGFYLGANAGGAWASGSLTDNFTGTSLGSNGAGIVGGGQLGYNYQIGNLVFGGEWSIDGTSLNGSATVGNLSGAAKTNWMTSLAARLGFAANNWLFYGKAGGGWANNSATLTNLNNGAQVSSSNTNSGWLGGAGVEYAFAANWSARLEYNYLGLNTWNANSTIFAPNADRFSGSRNIQTLLLGVNFKF
jgi:outer membrane immunogenic protein